MVDPSASTIAPNNCHLHVKHKTPEASEHTSIKERTRPAFNLADAVKEQIELQALLKFDLPLKPLAAFEGAAIGDEQDGIMFSLEDYLTLVDYTGRIIRGTIHTIQTPIPSLDRFEK